MKIEGEFQKRKGIPKLLFHPLPKRVFEISSIFEEDKKRIKESIRERESQLFKGKKQYLNFNRRVMGAYAVLEIPGKPIAKKRPRFARKGNFVITYNPQQTEEGRFILNVRQKWKKRPLEDPIRLVLVFEMPIPKSFPASKKKLMKGGWISHTKKPDLDNLIKFVKDCLNGVVYRDDSQIISINAEKKYSDDPKTKILVGWIESLKEDES